MNNQRRAARRFWPVLMAAMGAMLASPVAVLAHDGATATIDAHARIDAPISIVANQDLIVVSILLRAASANTSDRMVLNNKAGFLTGSDPDRASFVVMGLPDQAVSVSIPFSITLTGAAGTQDMTIETLIGLPGRSGLQLPQSGLNNHGLLFFSVHSRPTLNPRAIPGEYRGLLVATAQYN